MAQVHLSLPAQLIKLGEFSLGINLGVEQSSNEAKHHDNFGNWEATSSKGESHTLAKFLLENSDTIGHIRGTDKSTS